MALWQASQLGDLTEMRRLLDADAEPDAFFGERAANGAIAEGGTALVEAAGAGQLEAVRLLLDRGADASLATSTCTTPLMNAAGNGHTAVVRELAARGAKLDAAVWETGCTAFHAACNFNQPKCAAALVELGCDTAIEAMGLTGRQIAEVKGHAAVLDALRTAVAARLRAGMAAGQPPAVAAAAGANAATARALWDASQVGDLAEMARLLDGGAEPGALVTGRDAGGITGQSTALHEAAAAGQLGAVRLLLGRGADPSVAGSAGYTPLMQAVVEGHAAVVRELAAHGMDLDAADPKSSATAFHIACLHNKPECVTVLVELGCDTAITAIDGRTGKQLAEAMGHGAVLNVLHAAADPGHESRSMALYQASKAGGLAEMARLLDAGVEPDDFVPVRNTDGGIVQGAALVEAAGAGQLEAVRLLLDRGADPSLATSTGITPLMNAAGNGHVSVVQELAARGAKLDAAVWETGCTAFVFACLKNQPGCLAALVELGCDIKIKAENGMTGKQVAEQEGHAAVLERLVEATERRRELVRRERVRRLIARQAFGKAGPPLARMLLKAPADAELLAMQSEVAAAQAEAEAAAEANAAALLAELEAEGSGAGSVGQSKSQKKKEKQRRRKQAAAAAAVDGVPELGLEPELQMAADFDEDEAPSPSAAQPVWGCALGLRPSAGRGATAVRAHMLCTASEAGDLAEMTRLLDTGDDPDDFVTVRDTDQSTALGEAAIAGQLGAVRLLLDRGADPSLSTGITPLMHAAMYGHVSVVRELVTRGAALNAAHPATGATAFHAACAENQPESVAALVELGCDIEIKTPNGMVGKQAAEAMGHVAVLERLVEATEQRQELEAERAARGNVERLIALQAFGAAAPLLARMLRDAPADVELLAWQSEVAAAQAEAEAAAEANAAALLAELEAEGSGAGSEGGQSKSQKKKEKQRKKKAAAAAAAAAAADGVPKLEPEPELQMPVAVAAAAGEKCAATAVAFYSAGQAGDLTEMARLLDAGAEPDAFVPMCDGDGEIVQGTMLSEAASAGQLGVVQLLLDRGADPSLADSCGTTPLMPAAGYGYTAVVWELATRGAALDTVEPKHGGTAFHMACMHNQPESVAALVQLGCDIEIKAMNGMTGKQAAEKEGHTVVLERLVEATERRHTLEAKIAQREEVGRLIALQAFGAAAPLLARMLRDAPADVELLAWQSEVAAAQVEAEAAAEANAAALLAELEAEGSGAGSEGGQSKSQKKKEKQRKKKAAAAEATATDVPEPGLEPEPELQMAADFDVDEPPSPSEAQPAPASGGSSERCKKKNNTKGPRPGPAAGPLDIVELDQRESAPGWDPDPASSPAVVALLEGLGLGRHQALLDALAFVLESDQVSTAADLMELGLPPDAAAAIVARLKPVPALEPELEAEEPEPELSASAQQLAVLTAVPMAAWSEEQVLAWVELVELQPETRAALRMVFEDGETDGEELAAITGANSPGR
jgi:ankyrin repeat protein